MPNLAEVIVRFGSGEDAKHFGANGSPQCPIYTLPRASFGRIAIPPLPLTALFFRSFSQWVRFLRHESKAFATEMMVLRRVNGRDEFVGDQNKFELFRQFYDQLC